MFTLTLIACLGAWESLVVGVIEGKGVYVPYSAWLLNQWPMAESRLAILDGKDSVH